MCVEGFGEVENEGAECTVECDSGNKTKHVPQPPQYRQALRLLPRLVAHLPCL